MSNNAFGESLLQQVLVPSALRRDPVRKEPRKKIRVNCRPMNSSIPRAEEGVESNLIKQGVGEYLVYEKDLPKVLALVEPYPDRVKASFETYERKLRAYVKEKGGVEPPADRALWTDRMNQIEKTFESNATAEFTAEFLRSPLPLISCEVLEDVPAPMDDNDVYQSRHEQQQMAMLEMQNRMIENLVSKVLPPLVQQAVAAAMSTKKSNS